MLAFSGSDPTMVDNENNLSVHVNENMDLEQLKAVLKVGLLLFKYLPCTL